MALFRRRRAREERVDRLVDGEPGRAVDVGDRGFNYGDGVFETLAVRDGRPEFWDRHLRRLAAGCERLGLPAPDPKVLAAEAQRVSAGAARAVLKIVVSRGAGGRGYRPPDEPSPTRVVSRHPWPDHPARHAEEGVALRVCATRLAVQPLLAGIKHLNRLEQVLARAEWDDPAIAEGLTLDADGWVIGGTMTNVFAVAGGRLLTPDVSGAGVAGVMRGVLLDLAARLEMQSEVTRLTLAELHAADEVLVCNSVIGIWPVSAIDGVEMTPGPVTRTLAEALAGARRGLSSA